MNTYVPLILLAIVAIAFVVGNYVSKKMRLPETGWKASLIVAVIGIAAVILGTSWPPKQGIDLKGGVILIYEVDEALTQQSAVRAESDDEDADANRMAEDVGKVDMQGLIQALSRRINPGGVQEIVVRAYGDNQVEIIIPDVSDADVERIKKLITTGGFLKFQIVANRRDHSHIWALADQPEQAGQYQIRDETGQVIGQWAKLALTEKSSLDDPEYRVDPPQAKSRIVRGRKEVLMVVDANLDMQGSHLQSVRKGYQDVSPAVFFDTTMTGARLMEALTDSNLPDTTSGHYSLLGIVMDNSLLSAPRINSRIGASGVIEGNFTDEEVDLLVNVLRAGRLPAVLRAEPISQNQVSPLLGTDTIRQGKIAIGISLVAVLLFMMFYYRFAGLIACLALLLNLTLILALMIFVGAAFSLPGMAALVLTVGMSVDANVLIFERIREELRSGAALRMAIRNGFGRATRTIVDANLTTLITAIVLYLIGTEQLKAFAIALILGILMTLFSAIFFSRVVFELYEKTGNLKKLTMLSWFTDVKLNLFSKRQMAAVFSLVLIAVGMAAVGSRGRKIFDIDFLGGTSVQMLLREPMAVADVRPRVDWLRENGIVQDVSVTEVTSQTHGGERIYRVDTSLPAEATTEAAVGSAIDRVKQALIEQFRGENGESLLQTHSLTFSAPADFAEEKVDGDDASALLSASDISLDEAMDATTLSELIQAAATKLSMGQPGIVLANPEWDERSSQAYDEWQVRMSVPPADADRLLSSVRDSIVGAPVWLSASQIGSSVAGDMTQLALGAVFGSLIGIIAYIWFRFQHVSYGLAAVIALVHDVLVTLGAIALSFWLQDVLGFLMIDEFKISLPVVAAFLTIIGYSLNDTIVLFDRIREVKGKSPKLSADIINNSINQTLSRTLLTSLTTLLAVSILYVIGGQGIHAFAFALLVGVIIGTYSSIFIASPALHWMSKWGDEVDQKPVADKVAV